MEDYEEIEEMLETLMNLYADNEESRKSLRNLSIEISRVKRVGRIRSKIIKKRIRL